jgi:hypothetical protein
MIWAEKMTIKKNRDRSKKRHTMDDCTVTGCTWCTAYKKDSMRREKKELFGDDMFDSDDSKFEVSDPMATNLLRGD